MRKHLKWAVPVGILAILFIWFISIYNSIVSKDETVAEKWGNVQSSYQRRADLIPNLVKVVKGYASHEKEVLTAVVEARAKVGSMNISASDLNSETIKKFQDAQNQLGGALSRLLVVVERYPDLKANQNFLSLQAQLEGTENRINVARNRFNEAVKNYNISIRKFPNSLIASIGGFERKTIFEAEEGTEKAPEVDM